MGAPSSTGPSGAESFDQQDGGLPAQGTLCTFPSFRCDLQHVSICLGGRIHNPGSRLAQYPAEVILGGGRIEYNDEITGYRRSRVPRSKGAVQRRAIGGR